MKKNREGRPVNDGKLRFALLGYVQECKLEFAIIDRGTTATYCCSIASILAAIC